MPSLYLGAAPEVWKNDPDHCIDIWEPKDLKEDTLEKIYDGGQMNSWWYDIYDMYVDTHKYPYIDNHAFDKYDETHDFEDIPGYEECMFDGNERNYVWIIKAGKQLIPFRDVEDAVKRFLEE